jgi:hypothetical protein
VKVLSRLFRRLMLEMLLAAHDAGRLQFFGDYAHLAGKARMLLDIGQIDGVTFRQSGSARRRSERHIAPA